jgi:hypothetical protein
MRAAAPTMTDTVHSDGAKEAVMQQVSGCNFDNCPGVWDDGETVVVRGDVVDAATLERNDGEAVIRLPRAMVLEAAGRLAQG